MTDRIPKLRDERLCWLAVHDALARRQGPLRLLSLLSRPARTVGAGVDESRAAQARKGAAELREEQLSRRMRRYAVAVDELARTLSTDERARLRETGQVPDWFLGKVRQQARTVRL